MIVKRQIVVDAGSTSAMFQHSPEVFIRHVGAKLARAAEEVGRHEKTEAPHVLGTLANSIRAIRLGELHFQVAPGVRYAVHVHEGAGPGGTPPRGAIEDWIRLKGIVPKTPGVDPEDLPFLIRRKIRAEGIKGNPFADRTVEAKRERVIELANQGVQDAIKELTGGAA